MIEDIEEDGDFGRDNDTGTEDEIRDPFVMCCDNPRCLMPGPHFLSECHTVADIEPVEPTVRQRLEMWWICIVVPRIWYWTGRIRHWLWHVCRDCGRVDRLFGVSIGRHEYNDGCPHLPF